MTRDHTNYDLRRRTFGEELWLARKVAGVTQVEAAGLAGVARDAYVDAEADRGTLPAAALRRLRRRVRAVGRPSIARLLALARRRSGFGLAGVAEYLGTSRVTVLALERRRDVALVSFWTGRGFIWP